MKSRISKLGRRIATAAAALFLGGVGPSHAMIEGITGPSFSLVAEADYISMPDGTMLLAWGYGEAGIGMQYPGPTLIVNQGDLVTVTLTNNLTAPTSIVFPGQEGVTTVGGTPGAITNDVAASASITYQFTAGRAGTFLYHSGTQPDLQVEMGLMGALIVRPAGFNAVTNQTAYGHPDSAYDREYLYLLSEVDPRIHDQVDFGRTAEIDTTDYQPVYWLINGRAAPDTMGDNFLPWFPTQPYGAMAMAHPGERVLLRLIGGGRDLHPFHHHGNNSLIIAEDGALLESAAGLGPDLAYSEFTIQVAPGKTYDSIFSWTGANLGWDAYGHAPGDPLEANEFAGDHGKPFPVNLPATQDVTFGGFYSGSPFLGQAGSLPPGEGGLNPDNGYFFMWHSHNEKELANNDLPPGGMLTMFVIVPNDVVIH